MSSRISVMMSSFNEAHQLTEALDALLNQTRRPDQIVVVDDASTDDSALILAEYARREPIVHAVSQPRNSGPLATMERALALASGDYVVSVTPHDPLRPTFFEQCMKVLEKHPDVAFCCTDYERLLPNGYSHIVSPGLEPAPRAYRPAQIADALTRQSTFSFPTSSCVWRRSALIEAGGWIPELRWHCDWFAALVLAFRHGCGYVPEPLQLVRVSRGSYSHSGMRNWNAQSEVLGALLRLLEDPSYADVRPFFAIPSVLSRFGVQILCLLAKRPKYWRSISPRLVRLAVAEDPRLRRALKRLRGQYTH